MVSTYIPPLRTNSGIRYGYWLHRTDEEVLKERRQKAARKPAKLSNEELKRRKRERDRIRYASPEYKAHKRHLDQLRMQNPEYAKKRREQQKAYRDRKKAEKALRAAGKEDTKHG